MRDRIEPGLIDVDGSRMVERMDRAGVDASVILPIDWGPDFQSFEDITQANEHAVAVSATHPGRFAAFAGIDPRRPESLDVLRARLDRGDIHGLKLYPACGWHPAADAAMEMYSLAESAGLPVLFHTGDPLPILDRELCNPRHLLPVAQAFPTLKIWVGHAGAPDWWEEACELAAAGPAVKLEMSVWLWGDSDDAARHRWIDKMSDGRRQFGAGRLLFGSDHVSGRKVRGDDFLHTIVEAYRSLIDVSASDIAAVTGFTAEELALVMGGNALADLGHLWPHGARVT